MKSDRRHELQQNDLAIYLGRVNRAIEPYSKLIAVAFGVGVCLLIGVAWYQTAATESRSNATLSLLQAASLQDPEVLAEVSDEYPKTAAGAWSRLYQGNEYLSQGMRMLFTGGVAEDMLNQATGAYRDAIDASDDRLLESRANFGIARAAEALGDVEGAIEAYKACIAADESEAMVKRAQGRIDSLSSADTQAFLTWFGDQDFSPVDPSMPPSLPGGATLPDMPDLTLPEIGGAAGERTLGDGFNLPATTDGDAEAEASDSQSGETGADAAEGDGDDTGAATDTSEATGDPSEATDADAQAADTDAAADADSGTETDADATENE